MSKDPCWLENSSRSNYSTSSIITFWAILIPWSLLKFTLETTLMCNHMIYLVNEKSGDTLVNDREISENLQTILYFSPNCHLEASNRDGLVCLSLISESQPKYCIILRFSNKVYRRRRTTESSFKKWEKCAKFLVLQQNLAKSLTKFLQYFLI